MIVERKFNPITITLETQVEVDFLTGLLRMGPSTKKQDFTEYNAEMDRDFYSKMNHSLK